MILVAIGVLGISAVLTQLTLMRELLSAFAGNELVLGLVLGSWLLLSGLGAWLGRSVNPAWAGLPLISAALGGIALVPPLQVLLLRALRDRVWVRGAEVGLAETALGCLVLLLPYCLLSGVMLTLACGRLGAAGNPAGAGRVYVADAVGSIVGGVAFSAVLVHCLDHVALLGVPAFLAFGAAVWLAWAAQCWRLLALHAALALVWAGWLAAGDLDGRSTAWQFAGQSVLFRANSPYGRLVVTEADGQRNVFENRLPLLVSDTPERAEETVHFAMAQRLDARRILLVSGGGSGTTHELLKYPVREIVYVELDPRVLEVVRQFFPGSLDDPRIQIVPADGRRFIQQATNRFDLVILDLPDPTTTQLNRFFTEEFFAEVKAVLSPGGVLAFGCSRYENYLSPELLRVLSTVHRTLQSAFANQLLFPGGRVFFVASDGELFGDVAARLDARRIPRHFMTRHYLEAMLSPDRLADLRRAVAVPASVNRDFGPVLYYRHLLHWLSQFESGLGVVQLGLGITLLVAAVWLRPVAFALFASGFGASALQVVLLLVHQVLFGSVYQAIGRLISGFMLGLAGGGWLAIHPGKAWGRRVLLALAGGLSLLAALLPLLMPFLRILSEGAVTAGLASWLLPGVAWSTGILVGMQFPVANRLAVGEVRLTAGGLYAADFLGASLGAFLASAWLVPILGVAGVCWITAALNAWAGVAILLRRRPG